MNRPARPLSTQTPCPPLLSCRQHHPGASGHYRIALLLLLICLTVLLSGCAGLPISGYAPGELASTVVARLDADPLFAASPDGTHVAYSREGVRVVSLSSRKSQLLFRESPLALAWSPNGQQLAIAYLHGAENRIALFSVDGRLTADTVTVGHVVAIFWPEADTLLALTVELEPHSFGTTCREVLLRWQPGETPLRTILHDVTLKPATLRRRGIPALLRAIAPRLSPAGDELLYGRIQDPPAFEAYLKLVIRNLDSADERVISTSRFPGETIRFSVDGEGLLLQTAGRTVLLDSWSGAEKPDRDLPGQESLPSARCCLSADGRFVEADGRTVQLPPRTNGQFLGDGRLLSSHNGRLYLVSGFAPTAAVPALPLEKQKRLRTLRAWRAAGLISADEYHTAREKVVK